MLKRIADWIREKVPYTWARLLLLSRTVWGALLIALEFAAQHVPEIQTVLTQIGVPQWAPTLVGLLLVLISRYLDAVSGANRP